MLNMSQKRIVFTKKLPTPWKYGMVHGLFPNHLHSFDSPIAVEPPACCCRCCLLLAKTCESSLDAKRWCKTSTG